MDTRQTGRIMETEAGKISFSSRSVQSVSNGISTIPPPAPNSPLTAPALNPASTSRNLDLHTENTSWGKLFPQEVFLCIYRSFSNASVYSLPVAPSFVPVTLILHALRAASKRSAASIRQICRRSNASAFRILAGLA